MTLAPQRVTILTYHSLDTSGSVISVSPAAFREHMQALAERGVCGVTLAELVLAWESGGPLPERPVVLTFDDGFVNVAEHGAPVLSRLGFRATLFAVAGHCGGHNDWPSQSQRVPRLPLLSLAQLRELAQAGFEIGSHGQRHAPLDRVSPAEAEAEVAGSQRALEDGLGRAVSSFAYPYGRTDAAARALVGRHYRAACSTELDAAGIRDDRHFLSRVDVYYVRPRILFATLDTAPGRVYLTARRFGRRLRQRLARDGVA